MLNVLKTYKLYIYTAAAALLIGAWLVDRHSQYEAGKQWCQMKELETLAKQTPAAIAKADEARKEVAKAEQQHAQTMVDIHEASNDSPCNFSDNELFILNKAITQANSRSTSSSGKVRSTTTAKPTR